MKNFEDLYNQLNNNQELKTAWQKEREEAKTIKKITMPISIISTITILIIIIKNIGFNIMLIPFMCGGLLFPNLIIYIIALFFRKEHGKYQKIYKGTVINKLINNFYNNVEYFPNKEMPERIYNEPKYNEYYNRYHSDDYIEAKINNNYDINMAEVDTKKVETKRDKDGHTHTTTTTIFHGLFAKIVMDKSINSELKIQQNGTYSFGFSSKDRLEMDSSEFEKHFDVSATNKIIGMQLLTADIMEELIEFKNKTNIEYDIIIVNDKIYLRFHCGTMFEPKTLKKEFLDRKSIEKYFYMLNFTYNLSDKLIKLIQETEI